MWKFVMSIPEVCFAVCVAGCQRWIWRLSTKEGATVTKSMTLAADFMCSERSEMVPL
jgi:hypothetical protein